MEKLLVKDLEDRDDLMFISDSQDVYLIKEYLGYQHYSFEAFFVKVGEGEYEEVYGMYGIVPFLNYEVWRIV